MAMITVFVPKSIVGDPRKLARAVTNALDGAAKGALVDFKTTTATWDHQPAFDIQSPSADRRIVGTNDDIYKFVTGGTKPHVIEARNASVLAFYWPKIGGMFYGRKVNHPGNKAYRIFGDAFDGMRGEITTTLERAVRTAASQARGL